MTCRSRFMHRETDSAEIIVFQSTIRSSAKIRGAKRNPTQVIVDLLCVTFSCNCY